MRLATVLLLASIGAVATPLSSEIALARIQHNKSEDTGVIDEFLARNLYWYGQFDVGDAKNLSLLIDTGSPSLVVDPGKYIPSKNARTFRNANHSFIYEGVARDGFGFETDNSTLVEDTVSAAGGLTVPNQGVFVIHSYKIIGAKPLPYAWLYDGLIGFDTVPHPRYVGGKRHVQAWFYNLCHQKLIAECRFGLAYGTDGKGMMAIGKLANRLFKGSLVTAPYNYNGPYNYGDVYLNGKLFATDQLLILDDGTNNIQTSVKHSAEMFKQLGWTSHLQTTHNPFYPKMGPKHATYQTAHFPCDAKPPVIGFAFPPQSALKKGQTSTMFNISSSLWNVTPNGNGNCTSILAGTNFLGKINIASPLSPWLLGQPFYAGKYVDFDVGKQLSGFAYLKNPTDPTA